MSLIITLRGLISYAKARDFRGLKEEHRLVTREVEPKEARMFHHTEEMVLLAHSQTAHQLKDPLLEQSLVDITILHLTEDQVHHHFHPQEDHKGLRLITSLDLP